jgi:hypothetical protein
VPNIYEVVDLVTKEALRIAHEKLTFIGTVDRQYDSTFKYDQNRGKFGQTLRVREPNKYTRRKGSRIMDVQDQDESSLPITVATQDGVDMKFNSQELVQSVNNGAAFDDLSKNYIEPAVSVLTSGIEGDFLAFATKATYQTAGTPGTAITNLSVPGLARAKLNQQLAPKDKRCNQMDSVTMASLVNGVSAYFAPSNDIGKQYREGFVKRTAMAEFYENERTWSLSNGDDVAGTIDESTETNFVQGATTLHVDALGTTAFEGQVFTIAGIYDCHPETKAAYPHLKQFVLTADAVIAGNEADLAFSPAIYTTGAKKNVSDASGNDLTWTSAQFDGAAVTFVGLASSSYVQSLMYHPEAFQFITADLPLMDDAQKCVRKMKDGLSVRCWLGSDIKNDELLMRLDILYGMAALRPEWACRQIGAKNV